MEKLQIKSALEYKSHVLEQNRVITLTDLSYSCNTQLIFSLSLFLDNPITESHTQNDRWPLCIFSFSVFFLMEVHGTFQISLYDWKKWSGAILGGRRGRKGKDSEKGLCFLIKVRCRTDFVSLKEHASFSPSVVLSSIRGSVEVPWRRECPSSSRCFVPWPSAFSRAETALWADPRELWIRTCLRKISLTS